MQEIIIRTNGVDTSVFKNVNNMDVEGLLVCDKNTLSTCTLRFNFDKIEHNHECKAEPKVWTGKFICVANRDIDGRMRYTPGCVYEATELYIADDTPLPFNRGDDWQFAMSDFETLRKEFSENGIDIIEYKNEQTVRRR